MSVQALKRVLLGTPIPTTLARHERLGRLTGLAVFASDALSSVAYATEEILLILVLGAALGCGRKAKPEPLRGAFSIGSLSSSSR